jgi:flagellar biosynthesis protein FlhA
MTVAVSPSSSTDMKTQAAGLALPILLVFCVVVLVMPLPTWLLDLALAANIAAAVLMLLTTLAVRHPLEFSVFPSLLLMSTLYRLVLNIASTRLILTEAGESGTQAAGAVIESFGQFMAGGQLGIGLILFLVLLIVQVVVVNQGAARIGEVAARFALDGLPGRQLAIDADLQAGSITPAEATHRRQQLARQADFYGAMDGASRFVKGDAIAGLLITAINLVGGLALGVFQHGLSVGEAIEIYSQLTIGDGLVTQLPAFLISLAAALLTTRSSVEADLSGQVMSQILLRAETLVVAALLLAGLAFTGLPQIPLFGLAGCLLFAATQVQSRNRRNQAANPAGKSQEEAGRQAGAPAPRAAAANEEDRLFAEPLELELGLELLPFAAATGPQALLGRLAEARRDLALTMGTLLPRVKIRDNLELDRQQYRIRIHEVAVAWGEVRPQLLLAVQRPETLAAVPGIATVDAATGQPACWIEPRLRDKAVTRAHSAELLTRQQVHQLLDALRGRAPRLVDELVPGVVTPGLLHQVLCRLLTEQVPIRNLELILETLGDNARHTGELRGLTELVRQGLARTICQQYRDPDQCLRVFTLEAGLEAQLIHEFTSGSGRVTPRLSEGLIAQLGNRLDQATSAGSRMVVLTTPPLRVPLRELTRTSLPNLVVLSTSEMTRDTRLELIGQIDLGEPESNTHSADETSLESVGVSP